VLARAGDPLSENLTKRKNVAVFGKTLDYLVGWLVTSIRPVADGISTSSYGHRSLPQKTDRGAPTATITTEPDRPTHGSAGSVLLASFACYPVASPTT